VAECAARVVPEEGRVSLKVWTWSVQETNTIFDAFKKTGFRDVHNENFKMVNTVSPL